MDGARAFVPSFLSNFCPAHLSSIYIALHRNHAAIFVLFYLAISLDPKHGGRKEQSHNKTNDCVLANHRHAPRLKEGQDAILDSFDEQFFSISFPIHLSKTLAATENATNMAGEKTPHFETLQLHAGKEN
jgi:hypothetical protein